jgi:thiol peroxidase
MSERQGATTFKGDPLTLVGEEVNKGDQAPNVTLVGNDLSPVEIASFKSKVLILTTVPSLDTAVCDTETRRFNEEATKLSNDIQIVTVSMDLPFAQARWCGAAGVERVTTLSDHKDASLGQSYGVLIKELRLLARTVFVIDREGKITYRELVKEMTDEPDYNAAIEAARNLV